MSEAPKPEIKPFAETLRDLVIDRGITTALGNPNWSELARMASVHYETLRKAVVGDRRPLPQLMEACAEALAVEPTVFAEYALWQAQRDFDPREVGHEQALNNLARWNAQRIRVPLGGW